MSVFDGIEMVHGRRWRALTNATRNIVDMLG